MRNRNATKPKHTTANLNPTSRIAGANLNMIYAIAQKPIISNIVFAPYITMPAKNRLTSASMPNASWAIPNLNNNQVTATAPINLNIFAP